MSKERSQEIYNSIAQWITPNFFFSVDKAWDRMGFLGVFGDYVLSRMPGDIVEIGVGESSIYLTALAKKFNRHVYHCDMDVPRVDELVSIDGYFDKQGVIFKGSSDDFFKQVSLTPIALGFIDGGHTYEQAGRDFYNLLPHVVDHGFILLHDTYPPNEQWATETTCCGDVYKLRQELEKNKDLDCLTLTLGTAMEVGLTIVRKKPLNREYFRE
jgi:hypothetical protein